MVAMFGASMAAPLAMPPTVNPSPSTMTSLANGVGGHDGAWRPRRAASRPAAPRRHQRRDPGLEARHGERDPDQPGLADEDLARCATPSRLAHERAHPLGVGHARRAGGGVGVARSRAPPPRRARRWRRGGARLTCTGAAVARLAVKTPAAGTAAAVVGGHQGEVGGARRLDPARDARRREARAGR